MDLTAGPVENHRGGSLNGGPNAAVDPKRSFSLPRWAISRSTINVIEAE
jgi:hypothetical protein